MSGCAISSASARTPALRLGVPNWSLACVSEHEFANAYRPTPDIPLPYSDLVERLRIGRPLMAVQWFALQGCDADKELSAAELLIRGYGEAPQRTQILDALARLHRKL